MLDDKIKQLSGVINDNTSNKIYISIDWEVTWIDAHFILLQDWKMK